MGRKKTASGRHNFYLTDAQWKLLGSLSKKTGLSISEILRRAIDDYTDRFRKRERG